MRDQLAVSVLLCPQVSISAVLQGGNMGMAMAAYSLVHSQLSVLEPLLLLLTC